MEWVSYRGNKSTKFLPPSVLGLRKLDAMLPQKPFQPVNALANCFRASLIMPLLFAATNVLSN
jgi:hypothetical protein